MHEQSSMCESLPWIVYSQNIKCMLKSLGRRIARGLFSFALALDISYDILLSCVLRNKPFLPIQALTLCIVKSPQELCLLQRYSFSVSGCSE